MKLNSLYTMRLNPLYTTIVCIGMHKTLAYYQPITRLSYEDSTIFVTI